MNRGAAILGRMILEASSGPSLLAELRRATSDAHAKLDGSLGLLGSRVSVERYVAFLRGSLAAVAPLEARLAAFSARPRVPRSPSIRADLAALGAPAADSDSAVRDGEPDALGVPVIDSDAAFWGACYVIEGSALGGAVLARTIAPALELDGIGLRYLTVHGSALGERWREFLAELEQWGESANDEMRARACEAAKGVFDLYREALSRAGALAADP